MKSCRSDAAYRTIRASRAIAESVELDEDQLSELERELQRDLQGELQRELQPNYSGLALYRISRRPHPGKRCHFITDTRRRNQSRRAFPKTDEDIPQSGISRRAPFMQSG
jgi:hypothetical protein